MPRTTLPKVISLYYEFWVALPDILNNIIHFKQETNIKKDLRVVVFASILVSSAIGFQGCQGYDMPFGEEAKKAGIETSTKDLKINNLRSRTDLIHLIEKPEVSSLRSGRDYVVFNNEEWLSDLVPNDNFRMLLNNSGQIIVADTIYQITPKGTFFTHVSNRSELQNALDGSDFTFNSSKEVYTKGNVSLIKTFGDGSTEQFEESYALEDTTKITLKAASSIDPDDTLQTTLLNKHIYKTKQTYL